MDDYTLMTTESMALVLNDDGCCIRHPSIRLKETDANGDVYLKEACPECSHEYASSQESLLEKRRRLSSQIKSLEEEQEPPSLTKGELSLESLASHMLHMQQMQDILTLQKEKQVTDLQKKVEDQQTIITEKSVEIALLKERLSTQKLEMEKELKLIKRAVAMDRERRTDPTTTTANSSSGCADIRIDNLHVHGTREGGGTPQDIHDAAAQAVQTQVMAGAQEQMANKEMATTSKARSDSTSTEDTPHTTNGNTMMEPTTTTSRMMAASSSLSPPLSPKTKKEPSSSPRPPNRFESKGEVQATLPPESTEEEKQEESPSRVKALAQEFNRKESLEFVPPNDSGAPATLKPKNRTTMVAAADIDYIPDNVAVGVTMPKEQDEEDSFKEGEVQMANGEQGGVAKVPEDMWENDDDDDVVESEEEDVFDVQQDLGHAPGNVDVVPAKKKSTSSSSSFKKPGPLTAHLMETNMAAAAAAAAMDESPDQRSARQEMEASVGSLKPPGPSYLQPASTALSDLPPLNAHHGPRGPIDEVEIDEGAPPKVPLKEQVTIDSILNTSDRFEPRIADHTDDPGGLLGDSDTIGQNTAGPTVASSTYGEDRMVVKDQMLLDPYGDKGVYTGQVLLSTGLPHGSGKMIYEDDGRTYDGDWRHGRWHGWGRATFSNGDAFEGFYKYDQRHGHGKYAWKDGRIYEGDFKEDKRHGKGHFIWPDGAEYTGDFRNGQREGHGAYRFSDGGRYEGEWINGRYEGRGRCEWHDGRIYEGEWKAGMAHGVGVETYPDGRIRHSGKWIKDEPIRE